jgi:hypothetical protein
MLRTYLGQRIGRTNARPDHPAFRGLWAKQTAQWPYYGQTFPVPVTEVLPTIQDSVRSVNTTGLLRFADILVQPPAP